MPPGVGQLIRDGTRVDQGVGRLVSTVTCPNCWHKFPPDATLFIARHEALRGDAIAGPDAYRRFHPTRFDPAGDAIDARGAICSQIACPRCHLEIARPILEMPSLFTSIAGAPASGKTYYLTALVWLLRQQAARFGFNVADGDPAANAELHRYEQTLFLNPESDMPVALRKTETQGPALYQTVNLDGKQQTFPRPFQFTITPAHHPPHWPTTHAPEFPYRSLVLYDNAGEHFLPAQEASQSPVTRHLAESAAIFFMFDPTQDANFRSNLVNADSTDAKTAPTLSRQELMLAELAARVRRYRGLGQVEPHERPLIVLLAKADLWLQHEKFEADPYRIPDDPTQPLTLDHDLIARVSANCRELLVESCPQFVTTAEQFSRRVLYMPVSSLGTDPEPLTPGTPGSQDSQAGPSNSPTPLGIRPNQIHPKWVLTPLLWTLDKCVPGLITPFNLPNHPPLIKSE